ncbi:MULTISPECIES: SRPBCC family protein [Sphingobacterium]|uniref:SRPBCC family protein n=1 Tax=Sphingobacterium TaxID=28453 RepID=UPI00240E2BB8|nr:SRPBCC domain-containing protein [Sphingobacterium sp. WM]WFB65151.1 SRPBCC domain-containing protein [Sphingobacterium sp. WM]
MSQDIIHIERTYPISPAALWQAMTDKKKLKDWFFDIPNFSTEVGAEFEFSKMEQENKNFHQCQVLEVKPGELFRFTWRHSKLPQGNSIITWRFIPRRGATTLHLTHEGLEHFKDAGDQFSQERFETGWERILGDSLTKFIEKL